MTNDGVIDVSAHAVAHAVGLASASASAYGIKQGAEHAITAASNDLINAKSARIEVAARATATGIAGVGLAHAFAVGVSQGDALVFGAAGNAATNNGEIVVSAAAAASGALFGSAAAFAGGVGQFIPNLGPLLLLATSASNSLRNTGHITANGKATAIGGSAALARVSAVGVSQIAEFAEAAHNALTNTGFVDVNANADASARETALALGRAFGVDQVAYHASVVGNNLVNGLTAAGDPAIISVNVDARAEATPAHPASVAVAVAGPVSSNGLFVTGVRQQATANRTIGNIATDRLTNEGTIRVGARATAIGDALASAAAFGIGVYQRAADGSLVAARVANSGLIQVTAHARALALNAVADAGDAGLLQFATGVAGTSSGFLLPGFHASAALTNTGAIKVHATATAESAISGSAATAEASALGVREVVPTALLASAAVRNGGTIAAAARAFAEGWVFAGAAAKATGIGQTAIADGSTGSIASIHLINLGLIDATAIATAKAGATAIAAANAMGLFQAALDANFASAVVDNAGTINVIAHANAVGAIGIASARAAGLIQEASTFFVKSGVAVASFDNAGVVDVRATASAHGGAFAVGAFALGIAQYEQAWGAASRDDDQLLNTTGALIEVAAHASMQGNRAGGPHGTPIVASAGGIHQSAISQFLPTLLDQVALTNNGSVHVSASAKAAGALFANAVAQASGVRQETFFGISAADFVENRGAITVQANAEAKTSSDGFGANAFAFAGGVGQFALAKASGLALATDLNHGMLKGGARASASAPYGPAFAHAIAVGISQNLSVGSTGHAAAHITNGGTIDIHASAVAHASHHAATNSAIAFARGIGVIAATGVSLSFDVVNSGSLHVEADAAGNGIVRATASGILVAGGLMHGTIANHARMTAIASAAGAGSAHANGIIVAAHSFAPPATGLNALISNTGNLHVVAIVGAGGIANATAIRVTATPAGGPAGTGVGTIVNNSGIIYAAISVDGGATFQRGTAINVANAPNPIDILLEGNKHAQANYPGDTGLIYGNIFLSTDDSVIVENGKTCFNGVINSATLLSHGNLYASNAGVVVNTAVSAIAVGNLTIAANGKLVLVNDPQQGAAAAYVGNFSEQAGGDLILEARGIADGPGAGNLAGDNTLGKIVAKTDAFLAGHLEILPYAGLYANSAAYHVVSAGHITGQFADVDTHSIFLTGTVSNNANLTIDTLSLKRNAFNSIAGLTHNELAVATGIENSYAALIANPTANPNYARFVGTLFLVGSPTEFAGDLYQLSGTEYGQQAAAQLQATRILNDTIGTHLQLVASGGSDAVGQLIPGVSPARGGTGIGKGNIWVTAYGDWSTVDANASGPSAKIDNKGIMGGVDFDVDAWTKVGVTVGHTSGSTGFSADSNNGGNYTGWNVGLYGRYDFDPWYVQAIGTYGMFTNHMQRNIDINPSLSSICCSFPFSTPGANGAAAITQGLVTANLYDSHTYGAQGEVGYHWDTGSAVDLTPFLSLAYLHGDSDAFHENGLLGPELSVTDASATSLSSQLGLRFSTDWQITDSFSMTPVLRAAWEHEWDGTAWAVKEGFFDATVPQVTNSQFRVTGTGYSKDFADLGAGLGFDISKRVEAVLGYEGRWSGSEKDNAILGHVNVTW